MCFQVIYHYVEEFSEFNNILAPMTDTDEIDGDVGEELVSFKMLHI